MSGKSPLEAFLHEVGGKLNAALRDEKTGKPHLCFVLAFFEPETVNSGYISNASRSDGILMLEELLAKMKRDAWLPRLAEVFGGRPVDWAGNVPGDYEGRERTLEVWNADAGDQLDLLSRFRVIRDEVELSVGGPIVVIFHTTAETARLGGAKA